MLAQHLGGVNLSVAALKPPRLRETGITATPTPACHRCETAITATPTPTGRRQ
jgi:hypothetical protein